MAKTPICALVLIVLGVVSMTTSVSLRDTFEALHKQVSLNPKMEGGPDDKVDPRLWLPGFNTMRPRQTGRHFADDIFKCILLNENVWITIRNSLKFDPKVPINNIPALVQIMAWRRPGDKPLSEPVMVSLLTHICVTRPQWVKQADDGSIVHELSDGGDSLHPSYIEDDIGGKGAFEDFTKMFDLDDLVGTGDTGMETIGDIF